MSATQGSNTSIGIPVGTGVGEGVGDVGAGVGDVGALVGEGVGVGVRSGLVSSTFAVWILEKIFRGVVQLRHGSVGAGVVGGGGHSLKKSARVYELVQYILPAAESRTMPYGRYA